jgi:hypothetical protein
MHFLCKESLEHFCFFLDQFFFLDFGHYFEVLAMLISASDVVEDAHCFAKANSNYSTRAR